MIGSQQVQDSYNELKEIYKKLTFAESFDENVFNEISTIPAKYIYLSYFAMFELNKNGDNINIQRLNNFYRKFRDIEEVEDVDTLILVDKVPLQCIMVSEQVKAFNKGLTARARQRLSMITNDEAKKITAVLDMVDDVGNIKEE